MSTRAESAAATRQGLLEAAASLLSEGGPDMVTLRAVGTRAGVSRGAPYRHFDDKGDLLASLATNRWLDLTAELLELERDRSLSAAERLERALLANVTIAREQPHLYSLMFTTPTRDPEKLIHAASGSQDEFLAIVAEVVGREDARRTGALLMSSTHGIAGMERSGQLSESKWETNGNELIQRLIGLIVQSRTASTPVQQSEVSS